MYLPRAGLFFSLWSYWDFLICAKAEDLTYQCQDSSSFFLLVWFSKPKVTLSSSESLHFELLEEVFCWSTTTLGYYCTNLDLLPMHILFSTFKIPQSFILVLQRLLLVVARLTLVENHFESLI